PVSAIGSVRRIFAQCTTRRADEQRAECSSNHTAPAGSLFEKRMSLHIYHPRIPCMLTALFHDCSPAHSTRRMRRIMHSPPVPRIKTVMAAQERVRETQLSYVVPKYMQRICAAASRCSV